MPQDAAQGRDALAAAGRLYKVGAGIAGFDFTKLDSQGVPLAIQTAAWRADGTELAGTRWTCVKDNHTGLVWEMKQDDPTSLSYKSYKYTWRNTNDQQNGGNPGTLGAAACGASLCDTQSFAAAMNEAKVCGITTWRLPSLLELSSIVVAGKSILAIDENYFPNGRATQYWSNQSYAADNDFAWYLYLGDGSLSRQQKYSTFLVRLVASPAGVQP